MNIENNFRRIQQNNSKNKFTMEKETQNGISYVDLKITREHNKLTIGIYRKPTTTDSIIYNDSSHPDEQKISNKLPNKSYEHGPSYSSK
jgi:hypothetical protein